MSNLINNRRLVRDEGKKKVWGMVIMLFFFISCFLYLFYLVSERRERFGDSSNLFRPEQVEVDGSPTFFRLAEHMLSYEKSKEGAFGWYLDQLTNKHSIGKHTFDPKVKRKLIQYGFGEQETTLPRWFGFFRNYNQTYCKQTACQIYPNEDSRSYYFNETYHGKSTGIRLDANVEHWKYGERGLDVEKVKEEQAVQEEIHKFIKSNSDLSNSELSSKFDSEFALKTWLAMRPINVFLCNEALAISEIEPQLEKEESHMDMTMCWSAKCSIRTTYFYTRMDFEFRDSDKIPPHCICAFISNCVKERMEVVKEIGTVIPVRQYGVCENNATEEGGKIAELARSCKFYMAFENTLLDDYITEKFFEGFTPLALGGKLVSVYRGALNINDYGFPKDSFINIHDFKSPTEMAQYLKPYCDNDQKFDQFYKKRMSDETKKGIQDMSLKFHLANVIKSPCKLCTAIGEMKLSRYLLFKLGLKPKHYRVGKVEFEEFIKSMNYDKLHSKKLEVLFDIYDRAYGRMFRKNNNKTNWNDYNLNWVTYVKDQ